MKNHGYVFVYGSLKVGGYFSKVFDSERISVSEASVNGTLFNLRNFPALVLGGNKKVYGEVHFYKNFSIVVLNMDYIEGYRKRNNPRNLYNKNVLKIKKKDGKTVKALVYTLNTDRINTKACAMIEDGIWPI